MYPQTVTKPSQDLGVLHQGGALIKSGLELPSAPHPLSLPLTPICVVLLILEPH